MSPSSPKLLSVYCDGSSNGRKNSPVGWAYIIVDSDVILWAASRGAESGTNNTAELQAAIDGLTRTHFMGLHQDNLIELVCDSQYVLGMATGAYEPTTNHEQVAKLREIVDLVKPRCRWVRGHDGNIFNETVDRLAKHSKLSYTTEQKGRKVPKP